MGIQQYPERVDDSVWPMQFSGPLGLIDTGNSPGSIAAGTEASLSGVVNFTVPNLGRPIVACLISSTASGHVTGNAAGYFTLKIDGVEWTNQRWHSQGTEWHGTLSHPSVIVGLTPGTHTVELRGSAEALAISITYCRTTGTFFG